MEALLQSGLSNKARPPPADHFATPAARPTMTALEKDMSNLVVGDTGEQKYIGKPSTRFHHEDGSSHACHVMARAFVWVQRVFPAFTSLGFFSTFNKIYPLFRRDTFQVLFDRQYSAESHQQGSSFAALNIVLAIGCYMTPESSRANIQMVDPSSTESLTDMSWRFFQNAYSMFFNILFLQFDLLSVQTLIAMAFFLQATFNGEGSFLLVGAAARIATSLGLHRKLDGFGLGQAELEQRQRVFWILYVFEKDFCMRIGRPSAIDDCDVGLSLPTEPCDEEIAVSIASRGETVTFYPFRHMCAFAVIQSKVYRELYAVHSRIGTTSERLESISKLDAELQRWKEQIPLDARPEHPIVCEKGSEFAIVILHINYYHCLIGIHRVHAQHELWVAQQAEVEGFDKTTPDSSMLSDQEQSAPQQQSSYELVLAAARSILYLAASHLDGNEMEHKLLWLPTYFPMMAFLTLFMHILQRPLSERSDSDLAIMASCYGCLRSIMSKEEALLCQFAETILGETLSSAEQYVQEARARDLEFAGRSAFQPPAPAQFETSATTPADGVMGRNLGGSESYPTGFAVTEPAFNPLQNMDTSNPGGSNMMNPMANPGDNYMNAFAGQDDLLASVG
ncbi:hypothetical protein PV08_03168 [Exophiala spinifera]|uniref:Xylanolytic transcriptional activator regulatory domain-containing protein n=1 Tax=Exophiala spinifera TaxID=91928 RepID=A0A0D2C5N4_9EURO|nr:uncharacterized protein PV08_03168 [Exophiala spinifera]KIW18879.1 hypothetical protein PV08_03168 [Exophiala spinifera]